MTSSETNTADDATESSVLRNVTTEMFGTTFVVLAGVGALVLSNGALSNIGVALCFGLALAISIGVIGAVANPMFTLALLIVREISPREAMGDWVGQIGGGILGAALLFGINDLTRFGSGVNGWDHSGFTSPGSVMAAELVFGVVLVVVLLSSISQGFSKSAIAAFTGGAYAIVTFVLLDLDGGGANPARSLGAAIFADTDPNALGQVWAFIVVPMVAAVAAVFVWLAIDDAELDDTIFDETILDDAQNVLTGDRTD